MPLFDTSEIRDEEMDEGAGEEPVAALHSRGGSRFVISKSGRDMAAIIGELHRDEYVHVLSAGQWSLHQMLAHLVKLTGPADVHMASWSITENPMRQILDLCDQKLVRSLTVLFDSRVTGQCPDAYQLAASNVARIRLSHCHAKALAIINDDWAISVATSANLTVNPRIERYTVCTVRAVAEWERDWIERFAASGDNIEDE